MCVSDWPGHPGGVGRLRMAAGGDLEEYWKVYTQHNRGHIDDVMACGKCRLTFISQRACQQSFFIYIFISQTACQQPLFFIFTYYVYIPNGLSTVLIFAFIYDIYIPIGLSTVGKHKSRNSMATRPPIMHMFSMAGTVQDRRRLSC